MNTQKRKRIPISFGTAMLLIMLIILNLWNDKIFAAEIPGISSATTGYSSILYNSKNGLPTSDANAVVQTSDGFIWIGGYSGLIRYDGNEFYRFDSTVGITSVGCLFVDSKDRLWIGTNDVGAAVYENGKFNFFGKEQGLESGSIKKIVEDENGNILLATTCGVSYIDNDLQAHMISDTQLSNEYICDMDCNRDGNIIGITLDGDIFTMIDLKLKKFHKVESIKFPYVKSVNFDTNDSDTVYFGTEDSSIIELNFLNGIDQYRTIKVDPLSCINHVTRMGSDKLWVCADNGIGYINDDKQFVAVNGVAVNNSIDDMMIDYEGNLWFASSRQGVMKIVTNRFDNISLKAGLPDMVINTTCKYDGDLYIGTDKGLYVLNEKYQSIQNELTKKLSSIRIRCIIEDTKGNLWICTYGDNGLLKYNQDGNITSFNQSNGLNSNRVRSIIQGSNGDMIVANSGGVNIIRNNQIAESYDSKDGIVNTEILTVCEGDNGIIYAGSDGGGIYEINNKKVRCIDSGSGLKSDVILQIKKSPNLDGYWIVTGNSIAFMENEKIKTIQSFPYSNNFDMYFANNGDIWILSGNGIYVVKEADLILDLLQKYSFYNIDNGMPSNATANARSYIDHEGNLYISGSSSVFQININQSLQSDHKVKLSVPYVESDGKIFYANKENTLVIPSDCKRLTIYGYALTFLLQNPKVEYYLEGFEDKPIVTTKSDLDAISYTNLKGGNYLFHLKIFNENGSVNNKLTVSIQKPKTFWESSGFIVVIVMAFVFTCLLISFIVMKIRNKVLIIKQRNAKMLIQQVICAFAKTIDEKDKYTNGHSFRVAEYATLIASELGYGPEKIEEIHNIALLHDIGKIAIPDAILNKNEELTNEEYMQMKSHASSGYEILSEISIFPEISLGARYHHEKMDGTGYPLGLKGEEIPYVARIIAVADTFDAMYSTRSYRKKLSINYVANELKRVAGIQLDEKIVDIMIKLIRDGRIHADAVE
ncbi:MAG: two-component regulator propeller domain-containing protein [Lachnospiraceae bacterium]|nr:two-component regulator propeller domain-containing protein [Lachnospiraceae bacterium]